MQLVVSFYSTVQWLVVVNGCVKTQSWFLFFSIYYYYFYHTVMVFIMALLFHQPRTQASQTLSLKVKK